MRSKTKNWKGRAGGLRPPWHFYGSCTSVDGDRRRCVASLDSPSELRTIVPVGALLPLDRGSAGRVLSDPEAGRLGRERRGA